jgi:hypothetical protein
MSAERVQKVDAVAFASHGTPAQPIIVEGRYFIRLEKAERSGSMRVHFWDFDPAARKYSAAWREFPLDVGINSNLVRTLSEWEEQPIPDIKEGHR